MNNIEKTPQDYKFKNAKYLDIMWNFIFILYIVLILFQNLSLKDNNKLFFIIGAVLLIPLFYSEYFRGKNIYEGNILKRKNLFDTTFGLNRICNKVDGFYDNEDIDDKTIKLFANNHESLLFTQEITTIMLRYQYIFISFVTLILAGSVFYSGLTKINSVIMGVILSYFGIGRFLDVKSVNEESRRLFNESLRIVNNMEKEVSETDFVEILEVIINYEALLSSMNFVLSKSIYNKKQQCLTEKWLKIKKKYKVYNSIHCDE